MKYVLSLLLVFMLHFLCNLAISEEKPTIEIAHDPFAVLYPHLGNSVCRKKAFEIASDKTIDKDKKIELWKSYKEICSTNGSYQLILADFYISFGRHYEEAKNILEKAIYSANYDTRYHKSLLHAAYQGLNENYKAIALAKEIIKDILDHQQKFNPDITKDKRFVAVKEYYENTLKKHKSKG